MSDKCPMKCPTNFSLSLTLLIGCRRLLNAASVSDKLKLGGHMPQNRIGSPR
jgi:hypothetical protein